MNPENFQENTEVENKKDHLAPLKCVTPLSKYLSLALFIILPFLGAWVGYTYAPERVVEVAIESIELMDEVAEADVNESQQQIKKTDLINEEYIKLNGEFYKGDVFGIFYLKTVHDELSGTSTIEYVQIPEADTDSFVVYAEQVQYARDKNNVYMRTFIPWSSDDTDDKVRVIAGADPETFEVSIVKNYPVPQGNSYQGWLAKDVNNIYYQDSVFEFADPDTFVITDDISINYDKNNVYLWYKILPEADPGSYRVIFNTSSSRRGVVFGTDSSNCFIDYEKLDCESFPSTLDEAFRLTQM